MSVRRGIEEIWYGSGGGALAPFLAAAAALYAVGHGLRSSLYRGGLKSTVLPGVPCVSVGNIVVGGTGKTPAAAWLVGELFRRGRRPAIVSRGYGGTTVRPARVPIGGGWEESRTYGDEPVMLAAAYPSVPVIVARDRSEAAALAVREHGADAIVADDAFQHWRLGRDLDIVLVDGRRWFGNGRLLPRGPLREPLTALARADAIVLTRPDRADAGERLAELRRLCPAAALATADILPARWRIAGRPGEAEKPPGPVYAFCGIADPRAFLEEAGGGEPLAGSRVFDDHRPYSEGDLEELQRLVEESGAAAAVTTAKDAVRLPRWGGRVPLYVLETELCVREGEGKIQRLLDRIAGGDVS